jgi:hypothetical protein
MTMPTYPNQPPINPKLEALTSFWSPPGVYQVTPNLWSAVGYGQYYRARYWISWI